MLIQDLLKQTLDALGLVNTFNCPNDFCVPRDIDNPNDRLTALNNYIPFSIVITEQNLIIKPFCLDNDINSSRNITIDSNLVNLPFILKLLPILLHSILNDNQGIPHYEYTDDKTCCVTYLDTDKIIEKYLYIWNDGLITAQRYDARNNTYQSFTILLLERSNALTVTQQITKYITDIIKSTNINKLKIFWKYKSIKSLAVITFIFDSVTFQILIKQYKYVLVKTVDKMYLDVLDTKIALANSVVVTSGNISDKDMMQQLCGVMFNN